MAEDVISLWTRISIPYMTSLSGELKLQESTSMRSGGDALILVLMPEDLSTHTAI